MVIELPGEIEELARELAARRGTSVADAVNTAVEETARSAGIMGKPRKPSQTEIAARKALAERIAAEISKLPLLDPRSPAEIMEDINST